MIPSWKNQRNLQLLMTEKRRLNCEKMREARNVNVEKRRELKAIENLKNTAEKALVEKLTHKKMKKLSLYSR